MSEQTEAAIFTREVERRLDDLVRWVIDNRPRKSVSLSPQDFNALRREFCEIANCNTGLLSEPEPEQGGPQYINDNPAPWP